MFSEPKTERGRRTIAVDATTLAILKAHPTRQLAERLSWGPAYEDGDLVFSHEDGRPLHADRVTQGRSRGVARMVAES